MQLYSTLLTMDNDVINIMSHKKMSEALTIGSQLADILSRMANRKWGTSS